MPPSLVGEALAVLAKSMVSPEAPLPGELSSVSETERLYGGFFITSLKLTRKISYKFTNRSGCCGILQPTISKGAFSDGPVHPAAAVPQKNDPLAHRSGGAHRHRLLDLPAPLGRDLCRAGTAALLAGAARAGRGPDLPGAGRSGQLGHHPQPDARLHRTAGAGIVVHGHLRQRHLPGCRCHADAVLLPLPQRPAAWPRRGPDDPAIRLPQDHRSALRHRDAVAAAPVARHQHLRRDELSAHGLCRGGRHHRGAGAGLRIAPHPAAGPLGTGLPAQD